MKKILIIILAGVLLHPLPTKAQFGQDAAALIGFLTPYLGALEALSEASGMEISDLKKISNQYSSQVLWPKSITPETDYTGSRHEPTRYTSSISKP